MPPLLVCGAGWISGQSHKPNLTLPDDHKLKCSRFVVPGPEQCALICKAWDYEPRCRAWTYDKKTEKCQIRDKAGKLKAASGNSTIGSRV